MAGISNKKISEKFNKNVSKKIIDSIKKEGKISKEKIVEIVKESNGKNDGINAAKVEQFATNVEIAVNGDFTKLQKMPEKEFLIVVRSIVRSIADKLN